MPPRKVKGGWKNPGTNKVWKTKAEAMRQHRAIKASQVKRGKK